MAEATNEEPQKVRATCVEGRTATRAKGRKEGSCGKGLSPRTPTAKIAVCAGVEIIPPPEVRSRTISLDAAPKGVSRGGAVPTLFSMARVTPATVIPATNADCCIITGKKFQSLPDSEEYSFRQTFFKLTGLV